MNSQPNSDWRLLLVCRIVLCLIGFALWQWASVSGAIKPVLIGKPTEMFEYLWTELFVTGSLWIDLKWTLIGVASSFFIGALAGIGMGLLFASQPFIAGLLDPFITALNAMPRIALAPLFIIWFGLGVGSKIALGVSLCFFVVLAATAPMKNDEATPISVHFRSIHKLPVTKSSVHRDSNISVGLPIKTGLIAPDTLAHCHSAKPMRHRTILQTTSNRQSWLGWPFIR